ncbi:MAG: glycosyltransferase family 2 protein [Janthinobacterium lividum]
MFAPSAATAQKPEATQSVSACSLHTICILIPAWQPTATLPALVEDLAVRGFGKILVVDDGSGVAYQPIFDQVTAQAGVKLLRHAVNLGKGRALKTGFRDLLGDPEGWEGLVTADADGQHRPEDIERVARALLAHRLRPVFGTRRFGRDVPLRSRFGNQLTRKLFAWFTGVKLADTQTGLRGLPQTLLPELLALLGERYEYEMTALVHLCRTGRRPLEVPIATIYLENNRGSHFNPVWDSIRVLFVLLRSCMPNPRGVSS